MDGHLVAVEVGVERRRDERVDADGLALDEDRLERLDAEAVERRRAVEHHRVPLDHLLEDVEHVGGAAVDDLLRALDRLHDAALDELADDERLEELDGHLLREPALVQPELRPDDDDGTARVVDALAEEVLAEPALLALEHVAQRLERAVRVRADGVGLPAVVEEGVHRFLKHALLVAEDDLGGLDVHQPLQPVVPDDDAAVEVVEVGGREAAAFERDERAELRRDDGDDLHHHPLGPVLHLLVRLAEVLHDGEPLERVGLAGLARLGLGLEAELARETREILPLEEFLDGLAADHGDELLGVLVREAVVVLADLVEDVVILVLRQQLPFLDAEAGGRAGLDDDVGLVVDHLLEVLRLHPEQVPDLVRDALEVPDVDDGDGQGDVPHPLAAHLLLRHLDAAAVADDAFVADAFVLAAVALPVLDGAEDLLAEQPVFLGLERAVVDRLRLQDLAVAPLEDGFRRGEADGDRGDAAFARRGLRGSVCHVLYREL